MNNRTNHIYPAILSDSLETVTQQLAIVRELDSIQTVQIDVIDGYFTDNVTVFPEDLTEVDFQPFELDFHFMVNEPVDFILQTAALPTRLPVRAMIAQVERMSSQAEYISEVKRQDWKTGLSIDLHTPLEAIEKESWAELDVVQIMGIEAGEQGQSFVPLVLDKIRATREYLTTHNLDVELLVDGGIKLTNAQAIIEAGATGLTVGSLFWQAQNPQQIAEELQRFVR